MGDLKLKLKNLSNTTQNVALFDASTSKVVSFYQFKTSYIASYPIGTVYSVIKNGITYKGILTLAKTPTQFAIELSNLVNDSVTATISGVLYNYFNFPTTSTYSDLKINATPNTWVNQISGTIETLHSVYFVSDLIGYAVGEVGTILKTINGGTTWTSQVSGTAENLYSVKFLNANVGYAVGGNGTIIQTLNGGLLWTSQVSGVAVRLLEITLASSTVFYAVGEGATIIKTSNAGALWVSQISGVAEDLLSIYAVDVNNVWAVGYNSTIINTSNGGVNWNPQVSGDVSNLESIKMLDANNGWICGSNGIVQKTVNAGVNWTAIDLGTTTFYDVYFTDSNNGIFVGNNGTIIKTTDGLATQNSQSSANDINSVSFFDVYNAWIVGENGRISVFGLNAVSTYTPTTIYATQDNTNVTLAGQTATVNAIFNEQISTPYITQELIFTANGNSGVTPFVSVTLNNNSADGNESSEVLIATPDLYQNQPDVIKIDVGNFVLNGTNTMTVSLGANTDVTMKMNYKQKSKGIPDDEYTRYFWIPEFSLRSRLKYEILPVELNNDL